MRGEAGQARYRPVFRQRIAHVRGQQRAELRSPQLQRLQEQAHVVQLLRVRRVLQEFDGLLIGGLFFFRNVLESKVLISGAIVEQHAVVEGKLAAQVVAQHDVRELMSENRGEAGLVGKHVHQPAADHDGVAHAESFQRSSEQDACAHRPWQVNIVGDLQIVHHGLKNPIHFACGGEQASAGQAIDDVVFRLLLPYPLRL